MERKYRFPLAFGIAAAWILFIACFAGIYFETNDDRMITEILSGAMTGEPEAHAYYVDYLLGFPLTLLYRWIPNVPWYGGMLVLFQFLSCFLVADAFLQGGGSASGKGEQTGRGHGRKENFLLGLGCCLVIYAACFYVISSIQFTSTAAMLAIAGYVCFLLYPEGKKRYCLFFLLQLLAYLLRSKAMLMIQPMGVLVLLGFCFGGFSVKEWMGRSRPLVYVSVCLLAVLLVGQGSHAIFYHGQGWQEYEKVVDAITEITDYAAIPQYQDVSHILEKYHVTQKQYEAFGVYAMIEENLSGDCLLEIAEVARSQKVAPTFSGLIEGLLESYITRDYWDLNLLLLAAWGAVLLFFLIEKAFSFLPSLAGLFLGRSAIWLFLLYGGRTPPRVMVPLYLAETALLLCLFFGIYDSRPFSGRWLPTLFILLLMLSGTQSLRRQYAFLSAKNAGEEVYFQGMEDVLSYCASHPEKRYFLDASSLIYYRGSAFETEIYGRRNGVVTGCWYSGAPVLYKRLREYFDGCDMLYLVASSDMEMQYGAVVSYLEERLDTSAYKEDTFRVSNGGEYLVYAFPVENVE